MKSTVNKFAMMLVLFALMGLPARARGDQETRQLLRALKTASLTRLTLALSPQRMPDLTPTMRSKALGHIKVANRKITTILANPKLSDEAKKKRLIQVQNEGAARVVRELGPAEKSLKEAYLRLKAEVYWDEPVYQSFPAETLSALKKQVQAVEVFGGSNGFIIVGWGDVG